jgi:orotate phosphoribosyltransferase
VESAYLRGDFVLSSGGRSKYYFDKYLFETKPAILKMVARELAERVPAGIDRIAGPELGAVALATAVSLETGLPFVIVRKGVKGYGRSRSIEGEMHEGERILLVEDVISTAAEALRAARALLEAGAKVEQVLAVIDREQEGRENLTAAGFRLETLFKLSDLPIDQAGEDHDV